MWDTQRYSAVHLCCVGDGTLALHTGVQDTLPGIYTSVMTGGDRLGVAVWVRVHVWHWVPFWVRGDPWSRLWYQCNVYLMCVLVPVNTTLGDRMDTFAVCGVSEFYTLCYSVSHSKPQWLYFKVLIKMSGVEIQLQTMVYSRISVPSTGKHTHTGSNSQRLQWGFSVCDSETLQTS